MVGDARRHSRDARLTDFRGAIVLGWARLEAWPRQGSMGQAEIVVGLNQGQLAAQARVAFGETAHFSSQGV